MRPSATNPPATTPADQAVWDDVAQVLDELEGASRQDTSPAEFYRTLIARVAPLLAAEHAAVWLRESTGALRVIASTAGWSEAIEDRVAHQRLVATMLDVQQVADVPPGQSLGPASNDSPRHYLLAPIELSHWNRDGSPAAAVIELALPAGRAPSSYAGAAELLEAVREVAAEYHVRRELSRLTGDRSARDSLLHFAEQVGGTPALQPTALAIANEGARTLGCDRLSVLSATRRGARLLAASGTDRVERRGRAARALERLATLAVKLDEPIYYSDADGGTSDTLPQVEDVLSRYVDEFHARSLAVVPIADPPHTQRKSGRRGVLVAEQFGGEHTALDRTYLAELARAAAPAMSTAMAWDELPLGGALRTLGWLRMPRTLFRLAVAACLVAALAAALLLVPADLQVDVRGQLVPSERQAVFAPRSAIVDELRVAHGDEVKAGDTLLTLRDPDLALEIERLRGEQTKVNRQLEAVRATRTTAATTTRDPVERYRLSAEEEELRTQLANLDAELALLNDETTRLVVTAPIAGMVTTWQVDERLAPGRPVERGQVLVSVANTDGEWLLELEVPDERLDQLREADAEPLRVEYRLGSDASEMHTATVTEMARRVDVVETAAGGEERQLIAKATLDGTLDETLRAAALRPGGSVRARILVGERPLGYVLTDDLWRAIRTWWEF